MTRGGVWMKDNPSLRLWQLIKNSNDRQQNGGGEKERRICHSRRLINAVSHSHGRVTRIKKAQPISAAMEDSRKKILIRFAFFFFFLP